MEQSQDTITRAPSGATRRGGSLRQFMSFGLVGGSGVLVNMLVVILCNRSGPPDNEIVWSIIGTPWSVRWYHLYVIAAFVVANLWNFVLNRHYTFSDSRTKSWWSQYWPFFLVGAIGQALGLVIITLLMNPTSPLFLAFDWLDGSTGFRTRLYWAQLISIGIITPSSFLINKLWSFGEQRPKVRSAAP